MDATNIIIIVPSMIFGIIILSCCISCCISYCNNCEIHSIENIYESGETAETAETPRPVINVD